MAAMLRTVRFTTAAQDADAMLSRRAEMLSVVRATCPGLGETRLTRLADGTWVDMWVWASRDAALAAFAVADTIPEVRAAFALTTNVVAEEAEIVDERHD
ncbi:hypothetical protein [Embleya sp. AB8]|uniref:hypothetical protein n=1 Tax=Embleya sp. AB8 TaxID=3156304 RepID=UPI003C7352D1